jgi:hypothetical protein
MNHIKKDMNKIVGNYYRKIDFILNNEITEKIINNRKLYKNGK